MALLPIFDQLIRKALGVRRVASRRATILGADVHYYEAVGNAGGPPLLLVHGVGASANGWYKLIGPLARVVGPVYAIDMPGSGFSGLPPGRDHLDMAACVRMVGQFCTQVVREPCVLLGHSLGAGLVLRLASLGEPPILGVATLTPAGARMTAAEWQELRAVFDLPDRAATRALLARMFNDVPWPMWLVVNDLRTLWRGVPLRKLIDSIRPEWDFLSPEELARIRVPSLVLWGAEDRLLPAGGLAYFREHLPQARLEVMPGWGHAPLVVRPREVLDRVVPFALGLRPLAPAGPVR